MGDENNIASYFAMGKTKEMARNKQTTYVPMWHAHKHTHGRHRSTHMAHLHTNTKTYIFTDIYT